MRCEDEEVMPLNEPVLSLLMKYWYIHPVTLVCPSSVLLKNVVYSSLTVHEPAMYIELSHCNTGVDVNMHTHKLNLTNGILTVNYHGFFFCSILNTLSTTFLGACIALCPGSGISSSSNWYVYK